MCLIVFLKNIFLNYYYRGYRRSKSISIFQRIGKGLFQMSLLLFIDQQNNRWFIWRLYVKFTERNTDRQKTHWWNDIRIFHRWYVIFINGNSNGMKLIKNIWHTLSVKKSMGKIITDIQQITDENFFDGWFPFVSKSGKFMPTKCEFKYYKKLYQSI